MTNPTILALHEDPEEVFMSRYGLFAKIYMLYLEVMSPKDIVSWFDFRDPDWDSEEAEAYHEAFKLTAAVDDAFVNKPQGFSIGKIEFGTINGEKVIYEQNASPLLCWRKRREGEI